VVNWLGGDLHILAASLSAVAAAAADQREMARRVETKVQTVGVMASIQNVGGTQTSADQAKAAARSVQKAMDASDRMRDRVRHRDRSAQNARVSARWISGWSPEQRCHLQPDAVRLKPPAAHRRRQKGDSSRQRGGSSRRRSAEGARLGPQHSDWFEVGSSRANTGSMPSWYTAAVDAGAVSADGRMRMAVFHRPSSCSPEPQNWARPATASGSPGADSEHPSPVPDGRPRSAGDMLVDRELSGGTSGTFDETGVWRPRTPGDDVLTTTVAAASEVQARGAATATEERPPSAASLRPRRQPSPLRTRRPASAVAVAQGQPQSEVIEWLAVAQLDSKELVQEADGLLAKKRSDDRPLSAARPVAAKPVPVAIVEPECAVHVQEQSEIERIASDPVDLPYAVASGKRAVPRRPWTREEAAALSVSLHADSLTLAGSEARADAERAAVARSILEQRRAAAEVERRRRQSGVSADGVRVVTVAQRSYDNGVGYNSLMRPSERADGRPTWGLLEWPAEAANALGVQLPGGSRTTWGS
jgi:hypothetical protein